MKPWNKNEGKQQNAFSDLNETWIMWKYESDKDRFFWWNFQKKIKKQRTYWNGFSSKLGRNIWTLGYSSKPDVKEKKKGIKMKWMFMKKARLTSVEIKHYCLCTELLAVWVHTQEPANALWSELDWGSAFPQVNCTPWLHNLIILPFHWKITPKKIQYSLYKVL